MRLLFALLSFLSILQFSANQPVFKSWTVTLEEPTGIYRRDGELVIVKLNFSPGEAPSNKFRVFDPDGRETICQAEITSKHPDGSIETAELLFPATIIPGQRPKYKVTHDPTAPSVKSQVEVRRIGVGKIELSNNRFGVIVNLGLENTEPAIVAAFNKSSGETRMLNLIDLSPDVAEPLLYGKKNAGIGTFLGSIQKTAFDKVEILESGPLRSRVRIGNGFESWEFTLRANSPVLHWRTMLDRAEAGTPVGFYFSSISAAPYEPFDKWMDGAETKWPDGWETDKPPDHKIGPNDFAQLPGNHIVYYRRAENYGAFGIYELDQELEWKGVGAGQFFAIRRLSGGKASSEIALAFPNWKGTETVLEARKEYRKFIQPVLSVVSASSNEKAASAISPAAIDVAELPSDQLKLNSEDRILEFSLNGQWKINWAEKSEGEKLGFHRADFNDAEWRGVSVPGTVHTQILEPPKFHSKEAEWISEKEWWYRRSFSVPPAAVGRRLWLKFDATDYYADIYLNGELLGSHEGYIDPYEFDVTGKLKANAQNNLAVRLWTPVSYYWRHRPYTVKGSYGAVDQKPDNITPLGITRPVRLIASGEIKIRETAVDTRINKDGSANVIVDLELDSTAEKNAEITLNLSPRNFNSERGLQLRSAVAVSSGAGSHRFVFHVKKPELWWTWDHGKPNLYTLAVKISIDGLVADVYSTAVGIREIEHIDWKFYLNGKRMFIRGTNAYYNLFLSEASRADYQRDIELMRKMNVNMIRLHCHFSNPEFYEISDEMGILIWQDYLEAWYPEDRDFSLKAAALYDAHIKYVRNHPSVAIWATSDEESIENYRDLTKHLEPRLYLHDPQRRPVQRSTGRYGDAHVYEGWYGGTIWEYAKVNEKFISELGATALPNYESLIKFLPNHWPIKDHQEDWVFRKLQIFEAMRAWGEPGEMSLKEYIPRTQDYVARLFQLAIERMRRLKYNPAGGILHFHAVDLWPSVTMAALDYYRQPTKAYSTVQRSFQMVLPSFAYDRDSWSSGETVKTELWLINDHWHSIPQASLSWRLEDQSGKVALSGAIQGKLTIEADSAVKLRDISFIAGPPGQYVLRARVANDRGETIAENNYEFKVK